MKLIINDTKTGKSYSKTLEDKEAKALNGKRIGEIIKGETIDLQGYEFQVAGGSDKEGFPMRKSLTGAKRKKLLLLGGVGFRNKISGMKKRKTVRGNTIAEDIEQLNLKMLKEGKTPLNELFKKEEKKEGEQ